MCGKNEIRVRVENTRAKLKPFAANGGKGVDEEERSVEPVPLYSVWTRV
jgi:hypothetical protein